MPELPEVETVRRGLETLILNQTILKVDVHYPPIVGHNIKGFKSLTHQKIEAIKRYGKYLVFVLTDYALVIHLRMEGKFYLMTNEPISKHEHVVFHLENKNQLRYHDVRKFGRILIKNKNDFLSELPLSKIGKEPWDLNAHDLYSLIHKRNQSIKTVLLDQTVMSGLGNIYVDETLFLSKVHPEKKAASLSLNEVEIIVHHARSVLSFAISLGGSTIRSYTSTLGIHGRFQNELKIHLRKGQPCMDCQNEIVKIKVGGRGTYVCERCQVK